MQFTSSTKHVMLILTLTVLSNAFPLFNKREIVTRMHTASTTNTVTDVYSTTTEIVTAPTVYYVVDGDVTSTSTDIHDGVNPTAAPTTTVILNRKDVINNPSTQDGVRTTSTLTPTTTSLTTTSEQQTTPTATSTEQTTPTATATEQTTPTTTKSGYLNTRKTTKTALNEDYFYDTQPTEGHSHGNTNANQDVSVMMTTSTQQDNAAPTTTQNTQQETTSTQNQQQDTTTQEQQQTTTTQPQSTPTQSPGLSGSNSGSALSSVPQCLAYSPYNNDGSCRSAGDVYSDLAIIKGKGVNSVRIYGTDCNSLQTVQPACAELGIKINQGLWLGAEGADSVDQPLAAVIEYGQANGWDTFEYITIGNEAINSGYCSVQDLISKIASVKSQLQSAGYSGQVTTSEPPVTFENHPELCTNSAIDFVGINPHSYFDVNSDAQSSGSFVKGQLNIVQNTCGGKNVVITETGYPSRGIQNGNNIPSQENQIVAVQSILDELNQQVTILSYTDDYWKAPGPYGIEQFFGIGTLLK
ncbi:putative glucan endo-1,3-beta-D-glucosidase KNAG_0D03670 [Huiozyma naganishii CBS 8797]|uniref:Glycoside hydrolase family 17 protein n=1 Tax=Huiozyma naganishii (strain ATCC MYA-139 / BCRC 22969 / CBS 8797 / KCTC 17520 / NBRC 10181 / NCYC 3082 / Yp74L-3) TaxID=1071383 RepID=J7RKT4_HUIN7|nr:hypothetical protein KNAG_0D03670 [Kazachstania naganishii CBS 8797]CCK70113.1 hypothetical protein KNAG_0D03670 [Kazachstania naganishii CBS 8797]